MKRLSLSSASCQRNHFLHTASHSSLVLLARFNLYHGKGNRCTGWAARSRFSISQSSWKSTVGYGWPLHFNDLSFFCIKSNHISSNIAISEGWSHHFIVINRLIESVSWTHRLCAPAESPGMLGSGRGTNSLFCTFPQWQIRVSWLVW